MYPSLTLDTKQTAIAVGKAIGGIALFGPFGIVGALIGKNSDDQNPCLTAIEIAKEGVNASLSKELEKKKSIEKECSAKYYGCRREHRKIFQKVVWGREPIKPYVKLEIQYVLVSTRFTKSLILKAL